MRVVTEEGSPGGSEVGRGEDGMVVVVVCAVATAVAVATRNSMRWDIRCIFFKKKNKKRDSEVQK